GSNMGATGEPGEPTHGFSVDPSINSVWWQWTPSASGPVTIDTFGSNFNTTLAVYTGGAVNALTEVASNDDGNSISSQSLVVFTRTEERREKKAVEGVFTAQRNNSLHLNPPPANDAFAAAVTLSDASAFATGSNLA